MKKLILFASCIMLAQLFVACGSSKSATVAGNSAAKPAASVHGTEIQMTKCEQLAYERPATRAWGDGTSPKLASARRAAEAQARGQFARAIATAIKDAMEESGFNYEKYATTEEEGKSVRDDGFGGNDHISAIAKETIENAVVIHSETFMQPNRLYHVFVCLEYQGDATGMQKKITEEVKQLIPDDERLKMEYNFQQFEKKINEELSQMGK